MNTNSNFPFKRLNIIVMLIGIGLLILGFYIMTLDKNTYGFGFLGITLGPLVVFSGFITQFVAIFINSVDKSPNPTSQVENTKRKKN